ncbi:MAG TPA: peptide chain release factor 2 [Lentisphaeria bacterium]|nr:MAG: peptide chain release factor 2 [Lentisphaerae bacterium GWF2_50_93]HCE41932.1 peptide chain release factor 2 [Lentisphaeria bacterium]
MTFDELKVFHKDALDRVKYLEEFLKIPQKRKDRADIETKMAAPDFWDSRERAQATVSQLSQCKNIIEPFETVMKKVHDFAALAELTEECKDEDMLKEAENTWHLIEGALDKLELVSFLSGKFDRNNAFFTIHAGAGGTESCDWASILLRMYRRWFERRGFQDEIVEMQPGDEAGIKSVTLRVSGDFVYGNIKAERGVHRLVRISPFDSNARRHTSFASVEAFPEIEEDIEITIDEKDLRVDTYRSSGAGGQHVNKTDSAIRLTHLPTGVVVSCQIERSQHKNRATAMKMLQARLYELEEEKRRKQAEKFSGEKTDMAWGNQIRSYVLHPYQMVKDLRTDVETSNTQGVLDGDLDKFVEAWLKSGGKGK